MVFHILVSLVIVVLLWSSDDQLVPSMLTIFLVIISRFASSAIDCGVERPSRKFKDDNLVFAASPAKRGEKLRTYWHGIRIICGLIRSSGIHWGSNIACWGLDIE